MGRLPRRRARLARPLPAPGPARRPAHRPRPHRAVHHRPARLGRHAARRTRGHRPAPRRRAPWAAGSSWAEDDRGFEVPVLVALTFLYADQPGPRRGAVRRRHRRLRAPGLARRPPLLRDTPSSHTSASAADALAEAEDFVRAGLRLAERVGLRDPRRMVRRRHPHRDPARPRPGHEAAQSRRRTTASASPSRRPCVFPDARPCTANCCSPPACTARPAELADVGRRLDARGMRNPAWCPWQLHLARRRAPTTPRPGRRRRPRSGAPRPPVRRPLGDRPGAAQRRRRGLSGIERAVKLLEESVSHLERSPGRVRTGLALVDLGAALRRIGRAQEAAETALPRAGGAPSSAAPTGWSTRARDELAAAGLRPMQLRVTETDTLTARERPPPSLAAGGRTGGPHRRGDARRRARPWPGCCPAVYRKMGTDRGGLADAAGHGPPRPPPSRSRGLSRGPGPVWRLAKGLYAGCGGVLPSRGTVAGHVPCRACPSSAAAAPPRPPGRTSTSWPWTRGTGPAISARGCCPRPTAAARVSSCATTCSAAAARR